MTENKYLEIPWGIEDTIENLKTIKEHFIATVLKANLDGKGKQDAKGVEFDFNRAIQALEEIQQCREYKEIFESHFSEEALKLLSNKEEFGKWLERGRWIAKKCDEINRELEQYRAIGTVEELIKTQIREKVLNVELESYKEIGTIEEFKTLKEKSVTRKIKGIRFEAAICPRCESELFETYWAFGGIHYCSNCGQTIDWQ